MLENLGEAILVLLEINVDSIQIMLWVETYLYYSYIIVNWSLYSIGGWFGEHQKHHGDIYTSKEIGVHISVVFY